MDENPLAQLSNKPKGGSRRPDPASPLEGMDRRETAEVSGSGKSLKHGSYFQLTFRLPAEYLAAIDQIADEERLSKEEIKRWVVGKGLAAYVAGERPDVRRDVRLRASLPVVNL